MISPNFNINEFIRQTKNRDKYDIINLAEQEATIAWRKTYRSDGVINDVIKRSVLYQNKLLKLIDKIRSV